MSDKILDCGHALRGFLRGKEFFSDVLTAAAAGRAPKPIEVICEDMGDVDTRIAKSLAEAVGACVVIRMVGGKIPSKDNGAPVFEPATYRFRCYEHPERNRTRGGSQQAASKIAGAIERLLWTFNEQIPGYDPITPVRRAWGEEQGIPFYDVEAEITLAIDPSEPTRTESLVDENGEAIADEGGTPIIG